MDGHTPMNDATLLPARHKLDVDAYHRMGEAGILGEDDRIELIEGELIDMAPIGVEHSAAVNWFARALFKACDDRAIVQVQGPVRLDRLSEVQPDFAVLRPREDFYHAALPGPANVLLLVEVAKSSLHHDRTVKLPLYARAGIAEYWIVDLARRVVTAHRRPASEGYDQIDTKGPGERLVLALDPAIAISLDRVPGW